MGRYIAFELIGLVISAIAVGLYVSGACWMVFSYCVFIVGVFFLICVMDLDRDATYSNFKCKIKEGATVETLKSEYHGLSTFIVLALLFLLIVVSLYPFFFTSRAISRFFGALPYEGGFIVFGASIFVFALLLLMFTVNANKVKEAPQMIQSAYEDFQFETEKKARDKKREEAVRKVIHDIRKKEKMAEDERIRRFDTDVVYRNKILNSEPQMINTDKRVLVGYSEIAICRRTKSIRLQDDVYRFKDIISFDVKDDETTITKGGQTVTEVKKTGAGKRAVVGAVVAGATGAIIGGVTAKTEIKQTVTPTTTTTTHTYVMSVYVNNLKSTLYTFSTSSSSTINEAIALMHYVIANK